jgi:hypothetical protein
MQMGNHIVKITVFRLYLGKASLKLLGGFIIDHGQDTKRKVIDLTLADASRKRYGCLSIVQQKEGVMRL